MNIDRPHDVIEGSGRLGESRRLDQMISARLDPTLVAELKRMATDRGVSLSDIVREAALLLLRHEQQENIVVFRVRVTTELSGAVTKWSYDQEIAPAV